MFLFAIQKISLQRTRVRSWILCRRLSSLGLGRDKVKSCPGEPPPAKVTVTGGAALRSLWAYTELWDTLFYCQTEDSMALLRSPMAASTRLVDASSPLSAVNAAVQLCRVPVPAGCD